MKRIVIIGAGPGGYEAAVRAAQLGADVKLIEKNELGGTCVNVGCIPTKALWEVARIRDDITRGADMGIHVKDLSLDPVGIYNRKNYVVNRMKGGIKFLMKSYPNIEVIKGIGKLKNKNTVTVTTEDGETRDVEADAIIIATGSEVTMPEIEGINLDGVMTSNDILELQEIPESMVVIGSGVIGMEFTSIYSKFGTKIELIGRVMAKQADGEISRKLESLVDVLNVKFRKGYRAEKIEEKDDKLYVTIYNKEKDDRIIVEGEKVLVASGRKAYMDKLNADEIGIKSDKTGIFVDKDFKTNIDGIYAIGDVVSGNLQLAHLASAQGIYLVEKLMGEKPEINLDVVPGATYTIPTIAGVGKTEEDLKAEGKDYIIKKTLFSSNGKSVAMNKTDGFIKIIASPDLQKIYGVHIIGNEASDIIHIGAMAMANDMTVEDLNRVIFVHPSVSETFMETSHMLAGKSINTPKYVNK